MGFLKNSLLNEESCPVEENVFGKLHRASHKDAIEIAETLPLKQRARLAAFCYKRHHLRPLGLSVASICDKRTLVDILGYAGESLFEQSRDPQKTILLETQNRPHYLPKPVSLAPVTGQRDEPDF